MLVRAFNSMIHILANIVVCLAVAFAAPTAAASQGFSVGPLQVAVPADGGVRSIQVRNNDFTRPRLIQVTAFEWRETVNGRVQSPTMDVSVSPSVFRLPAAGVRDLIVTTSPGSAPRYYRLHVEELASENDPGSEAGQVVMRAAFNLPIFVEASGAEYDVVASARPSPDGRQVLIELRNRGERHAVGNTIRLTHDGAVIEEVGGLYYVLPGSTTAVTVALPLEVFEIGVEEADFYPIKIGFEVEGRDGYVIANGQLVLAATDDPESLR